MNSPDPVLGSVVTPDVDPVRDMDSLIIIGASTRAAAQSAIRAGYRPWCIDLFADRDLRAIAPVKRCPAAAWPGGVLKMLDDAPDGPVLFTGAMENHVEVVREIEKVRKVWGAGAKLMSVLRDPDFFSRTASQDSSSPNHMGITPRRFPAIADANADVKAGVSLLAKPNIRAGGRQVRRWEPGSLLAADEYIEEFVAGMPISGVFRVESSNICFAAFTEQIIGDEHFGAKEFQYVGNLGPFRCPRSATTLNAFVNGMLSDPALPDVDGVFGVDAIRKDQPSAMAATFILEINPRFPAGAEVWERSASESVLSANTIMTGEEPLLLAIGKAIVYAKRDCVAPDLYDHFNENEIADVPDAGATFNQGDPVCTVIFQAESRDGCLAGLRDQAERVYTRLQSI